MCFQDLVCHWLAIIVGVQAYWLPILVTNHAYSFHDSIHLVLYQALEPDMSAMCHGLCQRAQPWPYVVSKKAAGQCHDSLANAIVATHAMPKASVQKPHGFP